LLYQWKGQFLFKTSELEIIFYFYAVLIFMILVVFNILGYQGNQLPPDLLALIVLFSIQSEKTHLVLVVQ
jgi:hypothetical protein